MSLTKKFDKFWSFILKKENNATQVTKKKTPIHFWRDWALVTKSVGKKIRTKIIMAKTNQAPQTSKTRNWHVIKWCYVYGGIWKASFIMSFYHRAKPSIRISNGNSWWDSSKTLRRKKNGQNWLTEREHTHLWPLSNY